MCFFKKKEKPMYTLQSLEKAQEILDERFQKGLVSNEYYNSQCIEFGRQKQLIEKNNK